MLQQLIEAGFGDEQDYNCAERILYGANQAYELGLPKEALKLSAGFGGGMGIGSVCGALTAGIMVLGSLFVAERAHESERIKDLEGELLQKYREAMGDIECKPLKDKYRTEQEKCKRVIMAAAGVLDEIVLRERGEQS